MAEFTTDATGYFCQDCGTDVPPFTVHHCSVNEPWKPMPVKEEVVLLREIVSLLRQLVEKYAT